MVKELSYRAVFEQEGETYTRITARRSDDIGHQAAAWLDEQQVLREEAASKLRDARELETLQLAREANAIAERSMKAARISAAIAAVSVGVAIVAVVLSWVAMAGK
jgi:hypothetical protein